MSVRSVDAHRERRLTTGSNAQYPEHHYSGALVKAGHAHVHHHDIGLEFGGHGDGLESVGGFADDR